eukprot:6134837-Amphidinium_carterae.1
MLNASFLARTCYGEKLRCAAISVTLRLRCVPIDYIRVNYAPELKLFLTEDKLRALAQGQGWQTPTMTILTMSSRTPLHSLLTRHLSLGTCKRWFQFEEAVEDWNDLAELEKAPGQNQLSNSALSRLEGTTQVFRNLLDKQKLKDPNTGVRHFLDVLRP